VFYNAEANIAGIIRRMEGRSGPGQNQPAWQRALEAARLPLYDVHWTPAVIIDLGRGIPTAAPAPAPAASNKNNKKNANNNRPAPQQTSGGSGIIRVGLKNGQILPLSTGSISRRRDFKLYDVVYVNVTDAKDKAGARAELRTRPGVQSAAIVVDNATGKI